jgi:hypothetical protein
MPLAPLLLDQRGITGEQGPPRIKTGDLSVAENVLFFNLLTKDRGGDRLNATPLDGGSAIVAGSDWWPTPNVQRHIAATTSGKLFKDDGTGAYATLLKAGLTTGRRVGLSQGGTEDVGRPRLLFFCNGRDVVQVLSGDGSTTSNITTPPADWTGANQPTSMFLFRGSNVGFGNDNDPYRLYLSVVTDHQDFVSTGAVNVSVYPGEGERIAAAITAIGRGFVFKYPEGVYFIDDSASTSTGWFIQPITRAYGVPPTPYSVTQVDETTVAFINHTGSIIFMQETFATLTGVAFVDLFKALSFVNRAPELFNLSVLQQSMLVWWNEKKLLYVTYASAGQTTQDRCMIIDFNGERTRVEVSRLTSYNSIWSEKDPTTLLPHPQAGGSDGYVRLLGKGDFLVDGIPVTAHITTMPTDFSDQNPEYSQRKNFTYLYLEYIGTGCAPAIVFYTIDGKRYPAITFKLSGPVGAINREYHDIAGQGWYFSLDLTQTGNDDIQICRAWVEFDPAGERS